MVIAAAQGGHGAGGLRPSGWVHSRFAGCLHAIATLVYLREATLVLHKVQAHSARHRHAAGNAMADALAVAATVDVSTCAERERSPPVEVRNRPFGCVWIFE